MDQADVHQDDSDGAVSDEVRTRRLIVVDVNGVERAVLGTDGEHVEMRLTVRSNSGICEIVAFAGEDDPGTLVAGVELWANGNAIGGESVVIASGEITHRRFGDVD